MVTKEKQFFDALRDVFVGAKVEGQSGFINLMQIKSRYYEQGVFPHLQEDIAEALKPFPAFREELFDKLYTFFRRYFSESGSIYFSFTPTHQNVYDKVYTDDRDVILFWKTHMLYYVKTDRIFRSMAVEVDDVSFWFDVSGLEHKRANEKRENVFVFKERRKDGVLSFSVGYSEKGTKTKNEDIIREARKHGVPFTEDTLERAFRVFQRQSEVDFFINKNAGEFLREQFKLWSYQYLFSGESQWTEARIRQLQVLRDIAFKIIDFIAQFEDELVRVWNKPKFVLNSHYIITIDKISDPQLLKRILAHKGMKEQEQEWRDLGMVDAGFKPESILKENLIGDPLSPNLQFLPLDTRYFPDLELDILALFDDLDSALDGWLIHSENYQALRTLAGKSHERITCVYIDPPYNAEGSEILYLNDYRSSSWLSLMENRVEQLRQYLVPTNHAICVAVDDYEVAKLTDLLVGAFPGYDVNTIVVNHHPQGSPKANLSRTHEYLLVVVPKGCDFIKVPRAKDKKQERPFMRSGTGENNFRRGRYKSFYSLLIDPASKQIVGIEKYPELGEPYPTEQTKEGYLRVYPKDGSGNERVWRKTYSSAIVALSKGDIFCQYSGSSNPSIYERAVIDRVKPTSNWFDSKYNAGTHGTALLTQLFGEANLFAYPKSIWSVQDIVDGVVYDDEEAIIMDFFAGSGTTAHAVMNLNREDGGKRKYVLVEMGEQFNTVIMPRIKKVAFSDRWKNGKAQAGKGISHFAKCFDLEQYEDTLRRSHYEDGDLFESSDRDPYNQYVFMRDRKMLDALDIDAEHNQVKVDFSKLYDGVDLAETLSNLRGKWIKRITKEAVEFADGEKIAFDQLDYRITKPLIWW